MKGELTRSAAIKVVSRDLREMALHRGVEIDEVISQCKWHFISNEKYEVGISWLHQFSNRPPNFLQLLQVCTWIL